MIDGNIKARGDFGLSLSPRTRERRFDGKFARGNIFFLHFFARWRRCARVLFTGARERETRARAKVEERERRPRAQF